jgi:hypothetical protein
MQKSLAPIVIFAIGLTSCGKVNSAMPRPAAAPATRYEGTVKTEWLHDGRTMRLLEDFTFIDAAGRSWKAKKLSRIDGASIPRALWWTGGPYEGTYRDASVVHDVYCDERPKTATWKAVHRMFYDAMLTSGVERARALVMYAAVYRHGPRWPDECVTPTGAPICPEPAAAPPPPDVAEPAPPDSKVQEDVRRIRERVERSEITTPEQIENLPPVVP